MPIIFAPKALINDSLEIKYNLHIQVDEGFISKLSYKPLGKIDYKLPNSSVLIPGFVNAHTHIGDAFLKDHGYSFSLDDVVGPQGLKHSKLRTSSPKKLKAGIINSFEMMVANGFTSFIDFREGGLQGCLLVDKLIQSYPLRSIVLGRPNENTSVNDLMDSAQCDGLGFSDIFSFKNYITQYPHDLILMDTRASDFLFSIHISEINEVVESSIKNYGKRDVEVLLDEIIPDFLIHGNYITKKELILLEEKKVGMICCPITSLYFGLKFPPIREILNMNVLLALGTDNVLVSNPDPFYLMRFALLCSIKKDEYIEPIKILKTLTVNGGLLAKKNIGRIAEGYSADFVAIDLDSIRTKYSRDIYTAICLRATPLDICFQMFKGRRIK